MKLDLSSGIKIFKGTLYATVVTTTMAQRAECVNGLFAIDSVETSNPLKENHL